MAAASGCCISCSGNSGRSPCGPAALPYGWEESVTPDGYIYYIKYGCAPHVRTSARL